MQKADLSKFGSERDLVSPNLPPSLCAYAQFLLTEKFVEFISLTDQLLDEVQTQTPAVLSTSFHDPELFYVNAKSLLMHLMENNFEQFLELATLENSHAVPPPHQILGWGFAWRTAIREFLPLFTTDFETGIEVMRAFDACLHRLDQTYLHQSLQLNESPPDSLRELEMKMEELKRNEDRFHKMTELVEDYAILLLDKDGAIENWNKGAEKIKGYQAQEIIGKNFRIFYSAEDQARGLPEMLIQKAMSEGKATHEGWRVKKDGTKFWGYIVITALRDQDNNLIGFSKVTRDLTQMKEAEQLLYEFAQDLNRKNMRLEEINKELQSYSYIASHDLQEPLRKIKTFAQLILQKEAENFSEYSRDLFSRILNATDRLQKLIDSLLYFSELGFKREHFEETNLETVLDDVRRDIVQIGMEQKIHIHSSGLPVIRAIPFQTYQLFMNIIGNSVKYARKDVDPEIEVSAIVVRQPRPGDNVPTDYHRIRFEDNGIGFDQEHSEKIFDLFQRLHGKSEYPGTGIGLSVCRKIAHNHGGFIRASGESGHGACFDVFIAIDPAVAIEN